jgi:hypothetical protein
MKKSSLFVPALFLCFYAQGQTVTPEVISSNGGASQNTAGGIEWTIGEPVSATYVSTNHMTTMGFHQPLMSVIEMIKEVEDEAGFRTFPNPVQDLMTVEFRGMSEGEYTITLYDVTGRQVLEDKFVKGAKNNEHMDLHLSGLAAGSYMLYIRSSVFLMPVKITKVP